MSKKSPEATSGSDELIAEETRASIPPPPGETEPEAGFIRPSEIRRVWVQWCRRSGVSLEGCHWSILDAIYAAHDEGLRDVKRALYQFEADLEVLKRRSMRSDNTGGVFDCDDIAFYLRGKINGRAINQRMPISYCFGVAIIKYPDIFQVRRTGTPERFKGEVERLMQGDGPMEASIQIEHVINWIMVKKVVKEKIRVDLLTVEVRDPATLLKPSKRDGIRKRTVFFWDLKLRVTPSDLVTQKLSASSPDLSGASISMILV